MSAEQCRRRVSELIATAVLEQDADRRHALLVMADQWAELMRSRNPPRALFAGHQNVAPG